MGSFNKWKKKIHSLFRTEVDSAPLVYFTPGFASQPKLQVQYDGSKSKWELSNLISRQSGKHESWLYTPVKIQQWADRNVENNMAGMNIFPFSEWNHGLDSDKYDKSIAGFGVWPELALLLYLWVVYFLQYRPVSAGDTVYTALTKALRALPVLICRVVGYECCTKILCVLSVI